MVLLIIWQNVVEIKSQLECLSMGYIELESLNAFWAQEFLY